MASIRERNDRWVIEFINSAGKKRTLSLSQAKVSKTAAHEIHGHVHELETARKLARPVKVETQKWLARIGDQLAKRLAKVGLAAPRVASTVGQLIEQHIEAKRKTIEPASIDKLEQTKTKLLAKIPADTSLHDVTANDASEWAEWLHGDVSKATAKTHIGNAKTIFGEAVRRKLLHESPFEHLAGGTTASKVDRYVTPAEIARVIEATPDTQLKLMLALARYAGLRVTSETHRLRWSDVDWERGRLHVTSPKTKRYEGHEARIVPIEPRLMALLLDAFDAAEEGDRLLTIPRGGHIYARLTPIITSVGVKPWPRLWQTLRSSCEKDWAGRFPQYAVSKWIGHSITVSGKHYANSVPDELFDRAAAIAEPATVDAERRNAPEKAPEQPAIQCDSVQDDEGAIAVFEAGTAQCDTVRKPPRGLEPLT